MTKVHILLVFLVVALGEPLSARAEAQTPGATTTPEDSLTLEQCLEMALTNSNDIAISKGDLVKAGIDLKDARAAFLPELHLSGGYNLNDSYNRLEWNENHYSLSLNASMTPFDGGRTWVNTSKSRESLASAKQAYRLAEITLMLDVISRYYSLLEASDILELRKESLAQKRTHFAFAKAQFDLGLVPRADILKAEAAVVSGEVDSLEADGSLRLAHAELNDVMGIDLDHPTVVRPVAFERQPPPDIDTCLVEAFRERPELLQQESNVVIRKHSLRLAQIERWPKLTLSGSANAYVDGFVFGDLALNRENWEENSDWRVGIGLSFPIFDGGVAGRAIQAARIDLHQAELTYADRQAQVDLDVKLAHLNLVTAYKKVDLTRKEVESAQESYDAALGRYQTGVAPITEIIDAGVELSNSQVGYTRAVYDYLLSRAQLRRAMGHVPYESAGGL